MNWTIIQANDDWAIRTEKGHIAIGCGVNAMCAAQDVTEAHNTSNKQTRKHAEALAEALRWIGSDCLSYNEAVTRARAALANWEGVK